MYHRGPNYRACYLDKQYSEVDRAIASTVGSFALEVLLLAKAVERVIRGTGFVSAVDSEPRRTPVASVVESEPHRTAVGESTTRRVAVESLTVVLQVPNRRHPRSILKVLTDILAKADKGSAAGRLALLSAVALELLRRQASLHAASSQSKVCANSDEAQREFSRRLIHDRSKIEVDKGMFWCQLVILTVDFPHVVFLFCWVASEPVGWDFVVAAAKVLDSALEPTGS
jgi:Protein of unknown function (DUF1517)